MNTTAPRDARRQRADQTLFSSRAPAFAAPCLSSWKSPPLCWAGFGYGYLQLVIGSNGRYRSLALPNSGSARAGWSSSAGRDGPDNSRGSPLRVPVLKFSACASGSRSASAHEKNPPSLGRGRLEKPDTGRESPRTAKISPQFYDAFLHVIQHPAYLPAGFWQHPSPRRSRSCQRGRARDGCPARGQQLQTEQRESCRMQGATGHSRRIWCRPKRGRVAAGYPVIGHLTRTT
jgi:hypothetical protein